ELGDVDVTIDITLTLAKVGGEVVVFLHLNGRTARLTNCTSEHILMFLVIFAVLQAKLEHGFTHFCFAQFAGREAISPNTAILKEECSIQNLNVVKLVFIGHALEPSHCVILPSIDTSSFKLLSTHTWHLAVCHGRRPTFPAGFAIEDFQPLHVKRAIENGRRSGDRRRHAGEWVHRREPPWRTRVRRPVAPPSQDGCRSGTASVHPRRGARRRLPCLRRARACRRDLCHQLTSPPRSRQYRR